MHCITLLHNYNNYNYIIISVHVHLDMLPLGYVIYVNGHSQPLFPVRTMKGQQIADL